METLTIVFFVAGYTGGFIEVLPYSSVLSVPYSSVLSIPYSFVLSAPYFCVLSVPYSSVLLVLFAVPHFFNTAVCEFTSCSSRCPGCSAACVSSSGLCHVLRRPLGLTSLSDGVTGGVRVSTPLCIHFPFLTLPFISRWQSAYRRSLARSKQTHTHRV